MANLIFVFIFIFTITICAAAEDVAFCDSVLFQSANWAENFTLPKFDSNLGTLEAVEIALDLNLSQQVLAENTGEDNLTFNSTLESVLALLLPGADEIKANASLAISRDLQPFDGVEDFSGSSGMDLTRSSSSSRVTYSSPDISGFVGSMPGEMLLLPGILKSKPSPFEEKPSINISGSISSQIRTKTGASVCIFYRYDAGAS